MLERIAKYNRDKNHQKITPSLTIIKKEPFKANFNCNNNNNVVKRVKFKLPLATNQHNTKTVSLGHNSWIHSNRTNENFSKDEETTIYESFTDDDEVEPGKPVSRSDYLSLVYIKSAQGKFYKLIFRAVNCHVIPLYAKERLYADKETDKKIQPYSKSVYNEIYTPKYSRFISIRKRYEVNPNKDGRNSIMSFRKKIDTKHPVEPIKEKPQPSISASKSNRQKSVVYILANNINFKVFPKTMSLDVVKPLYNDLFSSTHMKDVGLETNEEKKNKGIIIAKYKGDILKFIFNMEDLNYQNIPEQISRAIQVDDENLYIKNFSVINNRVVKVPLPKKLYRYEDPMVEVRRKNHFLKINKIEPQWMLETRRNRLNANKKCQTVDPAKKAYETTNGSCITYEGPGTLNKARHGLMPCSLTKGDDEKYEKWIGENQRPVSLVNADLDEFESYENTMNNEVPDWDLVMNIK